MKIFSEPLGSYFSNVLAHLQREVDRLPIQVLKTSDVDGLANQIAENNKFDIPVIQKDKITPDGDVYSKNVPISELPIRTSFVPRGGTVYVEFIRYNVPFTGNKDFFKYFPEGMANHQIDVDNILTNLVKIELTDWGNLKSNTEAQQKMADLIIEKVNHIQRVLDKQTGDAAFFKLQLLSKAKALISQRKKDDDDQNERLDRLNPFK